MDCWRRISSSTSSFLSRSSITFIQCIYRTKIKSLDKKRLGILPASLQGDLAIQSWRSKRDWRKSKETLKALQIPRPGHVRHVPVPAHLLRCRSSDTLSVSCSLFTSLCFHLISFFWDTDTELPKSNCRFFRWTIALILRDRNAAAGAKSRGQMSVEKRWELYFSEVVPYSNSA